MSLLNLCSADEIFHTYSLVWVQVLFVQLVLFACIETKQVCVMTSIGSDFTVVTEDS